MPWTDNSRKAALTLLKSGQMTIQEVANVSGVSRQGIYQNLLDIHDVDLDGCRSKHVRWLWQETMKLLTKKRKRRKKRATKK
jgi:predicted DNA-binding protein YlxM (UPF0122 family)